MASGTPVVRVYRPSDGGRPQCAHFTVAAIREGGLTMCGKSTRGMRGRSREEHALAETMKPCAGCLDHLGHPAMIGG